MLLIYSNLKKKKLKKITDLVISLILIFILIIPFLIIGIFIKFESKGPIFYISKRVGKNKKIFKMIKFRTMLLNTPHVHSNDLYEANKYITKVGKVLRKSSIDELPQIFNVIIGDMSLVGPRPALMTQYTLINKREDLKINNLKPGITGLAQINGRDKITLDEKVYYDLLYKNKISFLFDIKILVKTLFVVLKGKDVEH